MTRSASFLLKLPMPVLRILAIVSTAIHQGCLIRCPRFYFKILLPCLWEYDDPYKLVRFTLRNPMATR